MLIPISRFRFFTSVFTLMGAIFLSSLAGTAHASTVQRQIIYGDIDGDGKITISDAMVALRQSVDAAPNTLLSDAAPVNADGTVGDGKVTILDAMHLLRVAVGLEAPSVATLTLTTDTNPPTAASVTPSSGIPLRLVVQNTGTNTVQLAYNNALLADFAVFQGGQEIWRKSATEKYAYQPTNLILQPGETHEFTAVWNPAVTTTNAIPNGDYQLQSSLPTANLGVILGANAPIETTGGGNGGLVVTLSTDQAHYANNQPATLTLTETNTGTQPAKVFIGCPFYDFWVTFGDTEVWRWSQGKAECLALGLADLAPGESRRFTAVWTGEYNRSAHFPLPLGPVQYTVHGQLQEPGGIATPSPVTITVGDSPADYFPLAVGRAWTYAHRGFTDQVVSQVKQRITETQQGNGEPWFVFDHYIAMDGVLLRKNDANEILQWTGDGNGGESTRYKLDAKEGDQWQFQSPNATRPWTATMVSRNAELDTPSGPLTNLLEITFLSGVDTSETDYLAPGIGLVAVDNHVNTNTTASLRLVSQEPAPTVVFPLHVGDAWTYTDLTPQITAIVPKPVVQTITGTVGDVSGKSYSVFDHYVGTEKVALREDGDNVVWQQTPDGETSRYRLSDDVGATWQFNPGGGVGGWNVHMTSRTATLETPYGTLSGLLEITFSGIDSGWIEYIAPGMGLVGTDTFVAPRPTQPALRLKAFAPAP